jgi:hypothetical protein
LRCSETLPFGYAEGSDPYRTFMPNLVISRPDCRRLALLLGVGASAHHGGAPMATFALQPAPPLAADGAALARVLQRAGLAKDSVIRVTGHAGPTAALWLSRHGYDRAAYVHAHWVATMESVDALLIPHACGALELADLLQGAKCMREGGALIVQTAPNGQAQGHDNGDGLLQALGYQVEHRLSERGRDVCIARRRGLGFKKAA